MSFESFQHPPPLYWEEFEDLCRSLFAEIWGDPRTQKNGRGGEEQHGVDIWGRLPSGGWGGVQCKGKDNRTYRRTVTETELRTEVNKALTFDPPLKEWTIVTSGPKNGKVEVLARQITEEHRRKGLFDVDVMGWEDLLSLIGKYDSLIERYFPNVASRAHRIADTVEAIHAKLVDLSQIRGRIGPADLLGGSKNNLAEPAVFEAAQAGRVRLVLGAKSETLLRWPTTTAGEWLDRPELAGMLEHLAAPSPPTLVLLGPPGSGKSALMARLGGELRERGTTLLAIKADALPREATSPAALAAELGLPRPVDECLIQLSLLGPVVLLIDQLDALADLMDQHGGRLGALLSLIALVRDRPNLSVILSSREFEFRHDARLTTLDATPMRLSLPSWEAVRPVLETQGFQPSIWHEEFREVLRSPQHLGLFLTHLAEDRGATAYRSYHDMLEEVFRRRILSGATGGEDGEALHAVARAIVEEEDLWVASARFDAHADAIRRLEGAGFLVRDGRRIGFQHQTLFDFVRARAFVADGESVADYALARQGTILARPTVWSALSYLRASDTASYERQLRRLWITEDLRPHMRWLLRDFVGQQAQPSNEEARLLMPALAGEDAARTLRAFSGSPGWFDRLLPRMPDLMGAPDPLGWACAWFLRTVLGTRDEAIIPLVAAHWMDEPNHRRAYIVLDGLSGWTEAAADIAERIAGALDNWSVVQLVEAAGKDVPHRVPGILLRKLEEVLAEVRSQPSTEQPLEHFLRDPGKFHGLGKVLMRTPEISVRTLWPWFAAVAAETVSPSQYRGGYRHDDGSLLERYEIPQHADDQPGPVYGKVIAAWARVEPDAFLDFARLAVSTDLEVLHLLLAEGFKAIAAHRPVAVLDYLLGDERRLELGSIEDERGVTKTLIAVLAPSLSLPDLWRLLEGILRPEEKRDLSAYDRADRLDVSKWLRQKRLELLTAIPEAYRPADLARHFNEELRALGEPARLGRMQVSWGSEVGMTAAGMAKAKDKDILRFLGHHPDKSGWGSPFESRRGRSVEASRVFGEFAKEHPDRARQLMQHLSPGNLETPVAQALSSISEKGRVPADEVVSLVVSLHERGFSSSEFRNSAAYALVNAAFPPEGLDDCVCGMLATWLGDYVLPERVSPREKNEAKKRTADLHPLLWGASGFRILPGGNYPVLRALELGLMLRKPPAADAWLTILERHLGRNENPEVWGALADDLRFLWHADRDRTIRFLKRLFAVQPSLAQEVGGLRLLTWSHRWLPDDLVHRLLRGWMEGSWDRGCQAAGEFAGLRTLLVPNDEVASGLIEDEITRAAGGGETSDFLFGVASTMVGVWADAVRREAATKWIERLAAICDRKMAGALRPLFHVALGKLWDGATERVLRAFVGSPALLTVDPYFLPKLLKEVLRDNLDPVLVGRVAIGMIRGAGAEMGNPGNSWASSASDLFEIATALQRIDGARVIGTELFEELLATEVYGIGAQLGRFDRNRFA